MTTNNVNFEFKFRTKFKSLLNDENRFSVIRAFNQFCSLDSATALKVLWKLTYSNDRALEEIYKLGLNYDLISSEKVLVLRNELRYQYEECIQDGFLQFYQGDDEKTKNAFAVLKNHSDAIVASVVCNSCMKFVRKFEVGRILYLLSSEKEGNQFGGVRTLGFDMLESDYLKPFHQEIHDILKAMNEFIPLSSEESEYKDDDEKEIYSSENIEDEIIAEVVEVEGAEEVEDMEPDVLNSQYKKIIPEEILKNKETFKNFIISNDFNMLIPIAKLGFDLNEVMRKKEEIFNFINIAEDLTN